MITVLYGVSWDLGKGTTLESGCAASPDLHKLVFSHPHQLGQIQNQTRRSQSILMEYGKIVNIELFQKGHCLIAIRYWSSKCLHNPKIEGKYHRVAKYVLLSESGYIYEVNSIVSSRIMKQDSQL